MVWRYVQSLLRLSQVFGGVEQMLQPDPHTLPHSIVVALLLPPLLILLQDDTVDEAQALAKSSMQQLHLLLGAGLLCLVGQGDDASPVWGVARQEALSLFLNMVKQTGPLLVITCCYSSKQKLYKLWCWLRYWPFNSQSDPIEMRHSATAVLIQKIH